MSDAGALLRLGAVDPTSNVAVIHVSCDAHARRVILGSPGLRFHVSSIVGKTSKPCHYCAAELERLEAG